MRRAVLRIVGGVAAALVAVAGVAAGGGGVPDAVGERRFAVDIQPLLAAKCWSCHGGGTLGAIAGLDLTSREGALRGGQSGQAALVPGDADASPLWATVAGGWDGLRMPPKENDRLAPDQVAALRDWIERGATWPDESTVEAIRAAGAGLGAGKVRMATSGGQTEDWTHRAYRQEDVWAFFPVRRPRVPDVPAGHPIDAFHRVRLAAEGVGPAPPADRLTLLRRATYGLTGLPPTREQAEVFLADSAAGAWERLVDRLLASPGYGEQWGRHWLDVVRYADTAGNSNDYERSNAWRYRDYVVRSLNRDTPYDRFVKEQVAGDEFWPGDPEMLVATGFLRMGPWGSAMVPRKMARQAYLDDVVHSIGQTFLSLPLRCAKCHDHKVDPVPTRDYYRVYAALATTQMAERPAAFLPEENLAHFEEGRDLVGRLRDFAARHREVLESRMEAAARQWFQDRGRPYVPAEGRGKLPDEEKPPRHHGLTPQDEGRLKVRRQDEWIWTRRLERYEPLAQTVFSGPDYVPGNGRKLRMPREIDADWRPDSRILSGGSVHAPGETVAPGVLSATGLATGWHGGGDPFALPEGLTGRRAALATWIAHPRNPLTARSIVNRVWAYHFGRGLSSTPNNLGALGSKPVDGALLDWLASEFVDGGWSLKRLHRLLMTSDLYRQHTGHSDMDSLRHHDPDNRLLAYFEPRRLAAEEIRDSMLLLSGELNLEVGGVPSLPEINMDVALQPRMIQFSIAPAHQPSPTPAARNRRSIYAYRVRGQADPLMAVFNQPSPNESCARRDTSTVSPQALTMLNSDYVANRSVALARRLERTAETTAARVESAYRLVFHRSPEADMLRALEGFVTSMEALHLGRPPAPEAYPTRITRSLVEEFTGAPFEYEEWLPVYEDYTPDVRPAEVGPGTRALADLCLLLFNSNEFAYVY